MQCDKCDGAGEISKLNARHDDLDPFIECPKCDGHGSIPEECALCKGSGEGPADGTTCPQCRGKGEL